MAAFDNAMREAARVLQARIGGEDGLGAAVAAIESVPA